MKVEKFDASKERTIVTAMIVNTPSLVWITPKWDRKKGSLRSKWANVVGGWCVEFCDKYKKAPGKAIRNLFDSWSEENSADKDTIVLMERFISELSDEYEKLKKGVNHEYVIDLAGDYFTRINVTRLIDLMQGELDNGNDLNKAVRAAHNLEKVELGTGAGIDVLRDDAAIEAAFAAKGEELVKLKGALGNFFRYELVRDAFISFEGPEKRGKTACKMEICWQAMLQGRKIAFLQIGDLSREQMMARFAVRAARRPYEPTEKNEPVLFPTFIEHTPGSDDAAKVQHDEKHYKKFMNVHMAKRAFKRVAGKLGTKECLLKLFTYPNFTLGAFGLQALLHDEERKGWLPDIIGLDYADLLAPPPGYTESRDQINTSWKVLRSISQVFHCLMLTSTQSKASSYKADLLDMEHFGEDKRKRAHVTGSVGINQTDEEKEQDVVRLNWIVRREHRFNKKRCVYCAGCRSVWNPFVLSTF